MPLTHIASCRLLFISWLQDHLLPCPFKYLTGVDCPGCGFQRSVLALLKGHLHQSFLFYPPTIPLLMVFAWWAADAVFKLDTKKQLGKKTLFIGASAVILVSYAIKLAGLYFHYKGSA